MTFNTGAFFYDYKDYQVSQIRDRTAVNENFDAEVWGIEFETLFTPTRNLAINANLGLMDSQIGNDARSIDIMDRTQGNPGWVTTKPWFQLPSNCIVPVPIAEQYLAWINGFAAGENVAPRLHAQTAKRGRWCPAFVVEPHLLPLAGSGYRCLP